MVKFNLPSDTNGTLHSTDFFQLNPSQFDGLWNNKRVVFEAEMSSAGHPGFPHIESVIFRINFGFPLYNAFLNNKLHFGLGEHEWHYSTGEFLGCTYLNNSLSASICFPGGSSNPGGSLMAMLDSECNVIGPRSDGKGVFPDLNSIFQLNGNGDCHPRVSRFHHHFTQVLGHAPHESVIDWQLRILVKCLKTIAVKTEDPTSPFFVDPSGLDQVVFDMERMHQELRFLQVLASGSDKLGDKPMPAKLYYDMLSEASLKQSAWPDDDPREELEFFPEISQAMFRFRSFPPGHPIRSGDTDESSSSEEEK